MLKHRLRHILLNTSGKFLVPELNSLKLSETPMTVSQQFVVYQYSWCWDIDDMSTTARQRRLSSRPIMQHDKARFRIGCRCDSQCVQQPLEFALQPDSKADEPFSTFDKSQHDKKRGCLRKAPTRIQRAVQIAVKIAMPAICPETSAFPQSH